MPPLESQQQFNEAFKRLAHEDLAELVRDITDDPAALEWLSSFGDDVLPLALHRLSLQAVYHYAAAAMDEAVVEEVASEVHLAIEQVWLAKQDGTLDEIDL